jgi:AcrR family transcriptional regulator
MASPLPASRRRPSRRGGRPTLAEADELDRDVREAALDLFLDGGYDGTTMDAIARAAGTTKASLYARFPTKEQVFRSVLLWAMDRPDWPVPEPAVPDLDDLEGALREIAGAALRRATDPAMVKLARVSIAYEARFPELARRSAVNTWPRQQLVVELLRRHAATGAIVADDAEVLAEHFLAMVAGMPARLASLGIVRDPSTQARHTEVAVQLFLNGVRRR